MTVLNTAAFRGFSIPTKELIDQIHQAGWSVGKIDLKGDEYKASAKSPDGETLEGIGPTDNSALGHLLMAITRRDSIRHQAKVAKWDTQWIDQFEVIAHAYAEAPVYDPKAVAAWKELSEDSRRRAEEIAKEIHVEMVNDPIPYLSVDEMLQDVRDKSHINISTAATEHPLWSTEEVLNFRLVHNVLGHCMAGGNWGWEGENLATASHISVLDPIAQKALFTETIGVNAFVAYYGVSIQKIVILDEYIDEAQRLENKPGWGGSHPSQMILPGKIPSIEKESSDRIDPRFDQSIPICPHCGSANGLMEQNGRLMCLDCYWEEGDTTGVNTFPENWAREGSVKLANDPNLGWKSYINPLPTNAYLWARTPEGTDPLNLPQLRDYAAKLNSDWIGQTRGDGTPDEDSQKQAIANAFRAVLLSPRKSLRDAITHYQDIAHIPATVDDPLRYWKALDERRDAFNQSRGLPAGFHRSLWEQELRGFKSWIKGLYPEMDDEDIHREAERQLFHMITEEEERIEDEKGPDISAAEVEKLTLKAIQKRLKTVIKPSYDEKYDFGDELARFGSAQDGVYPSFLASRLKPIAGVSHHLEDIHKAALEDASNGGQGHLFRNTVVNLGIPGIGPQEASYAWMMLAPQTSDLAVVDQNLTELLGYKETPSDRDYYKLERQLAAGRDAAGYGHIPLGQFGWGLWNNRRFGPGVNADYSALRSINPSPASNIDWDNYPQIVENWEEPNWWRETQDARDMIGKHWDRAIAPAHPRDQIPKVSSSAFNPVVPLPGPSPWFVGQDGIEQQGPAGASLMRHLKDTLGLSTADIWKLEMELGKRDGTGTDQPITNGTGRPEGEGGDVGGSPLLNTGPPGPTEAI